jgi:hypothetical protein
MVCFLSVPLFKVPRLAVGPTQLLIHCIPEALSLQLEWLGREADHSPPSSAVAKNEQNYTFTSPVCLRGVHRESFTFFCSCCQSRVEILAALIMFQLPQ